MSFLNLFWGADRSRITTDYSRHARIITCVRYPTSPAFRRYAYSRLVPVFSPARMCQKAHTPLAKNPLSGIVVLGGRLELPTPGSSNQCSNQLSYPSIYSVLFPPKTPFMLSPVFLIDPNESLTSLYDCLAWSNTGFR